jgi:steroid delta-isomerase-like uncharacterized protein
MADLKGIMESIYEAMNGRDIDAFEAVLADDFVEHEELPGMPTDRTAPRAYMEVFTQAFPDFVMHVEDIIQEGTKVMVRGRVTGTHEGEFMGMPATGRSFDVSFFDLIEFRDNKAIGHWGLTDGAAMMQQLGATP